MNSIASLLFLVFACQISMAQNPNFDEHWVKFKDTHKKSYDNEEEHLKRLTYEANVMTVMDHNAKHDAGLVSYSKTANHPYADMNFEQVKALLGNVTPQHDNFVSGVSVNFSSPLLNRVSCVDWRWSRVTRAKNQLPCGSCWAFGAVGAIEGQLHTVNKPLEELSVQQLVDCVYNRSGCDGGSTWVSYGYVKRVGGIQANGSYPYGAKYSNACSFKPAKSVVTVKEYVQVTPDGDEQALARAVQEKGPIAVFICINDNFWNYKSGVYDDVTCSTSCLPRDVNHAVVVVGYGTEEGKDYWLVKNSFGPSWGEHGFIRMRRNLNNQCFIASYATYPILDTVK